MIKGVSRGIADRQSRWIGAREQSADSARAAPAAAQVAPASVAHDWKIAPVALLDDQGAIIDVSHFARRCPGTVDPREFLPGSPPEQTIVNVSRQGCRGVGHV